MGCGSSKPAPEVTAPKVPAPVPPPTRPHQQTQAQAPKEPAITGPVPEKTAPTKPRQTQAQALEESPPARPHQRTKPQVPKEPLPEEPAPVRPPQTQAQVPKEPPPEDPAPEGPAPEEPSPARSGLTQAQVHKEPAPARPHQRTHAQAPKEPPPEDPAPEGPDPEEPPPAGPGRTQAQVHKEPTSEEPSAARPRQQTEAQVLKEPAPEDPAPKTPAAEEPPPARSGRTQAQVHKEPEPSAARPRQQTEASVPKEPAPEDPAPKNPAAEEPLPVRPVRIQAQASSSARLQGSPWVQDTKGLNFLITDLVCKPADVGVYSPAEYRGMASENAITFTTKSSVTIYNTKSQSNHEFFYDFEAYRLSCVSHSLSPDQKLLVRWRRAKNKDDIPWTIEAIDVETDTVYATLPGRYLCTEADTCHAVWSNHHVIYIVDSNQGLVTRWTIAANNQSTTSVIRPISSVTRHPVLLFELTKDGKWWVANGTSEQGEGGVSGIVQMHDCVRNEDRVFSGATCCVAEADIGDQRKVLFLTCSIDDEKLSIKIEQLDENAPGNPFQPINIMVDTITRRDTPKKIRVLEGLQIVVVVTGSNTVYFFDLHTGTYLYSESLAPGVVWTVGVDERSLLVNRKDLEALIRVSVNTKDLVKYIQRVIRNDALASAIAPRTRAGLTG